MLRFAAGGALTHHRHPSAKRLVVLSGRIQLSIGGVENAPMEVAAGSSIIIPPNIIHAEGATEPTEVLLCGEGPLLTLPAAGVTAMAHDSTATTEAVVRRFYERYNAHDLRGLRDLLAPGAVWMSLDGEGIRVEQRGPDALLAFMESAFAKRPSTRSRLVDLVAVGSFATLREEAEWQSNGLTRRQVAMAVYEVRDGRVHRVWYIE